LILPKSFLKLISSKCSSFWLTRYTLCLVDTFFNRRHIYGYKLCSSSRRLVPLIIWGRLHTEASQEKRKVKLARSFNFTSCYIDDVLSLNNSRFGNFVDRIYPIELEIKDTTDTASIIVILIGRNEILVIMYCKTFKTNVFLIGIKRHNVTSHWLIFSSISLQVGIDNITHEIKGKMLKILTTVNIGNLVLR
jgi:hypothetical protein